MNYLLTLFPPVGEAAAYLPGVEHCGVTVKVFVVVFCFVFPAPSSFNIAFCFVLSFFVHLRLPQTQPQPGGQGDRALSSLAGPRAALQGPLQHPEREARAARHQG